MINLYHGDNRLMSANVQTVCEEKAWIPLARLPHFTASADFHNEDGLGRAGAQLIYQWD